MPLSQLTYSELSDLQLFALLKEDSKEAFEEIYSRYWPCLIDAAYKRLQSLQKAEDIVQDLFIKLYQKRNSLEISNSFKSYLLQAVKFSVLNAIRNDTFHESCHAEIYFKSSTNHEFILQMETHELQTKIEKILLSLPGKCRNAFLLSRKEERTHKDISAALNISVSTVEKHIGKALKILRSNLKGYPITI